LTEYKSRTDEELKQLAKDIYAGKVFTTGHLSQDETQMIPSIFMPIGLGGSDMAEYLKKNKITLIYEYYDKAMRGSINGFPTFSSAQVLDILDHETMNNFYKRVKKAMNSI